MLLYASSIIENIAAGLCMSLVLYDQSSSANQRAHTENRSQNPSQSRHECRCDDTGDTSDQKHPKHQLRYLDMTDGGIRRSEIIAVTIHYTIGVQPAGTSEIARSTTLRSVISERALIQILNRKQRLLLTALRMLFKTFRVTRMLHGLQIVGMRTCEFSPCGIQIVRI